MTGDVRRAVIWLGVLVALIAGGDHLLALALQQVLVRSQFRYSRLYHGGNDAEVVVIGDSRGIHSFYAPALQELTGLRVLNLSYNSLSPHVAEALMLDYLERNRAPRMVVIEATCVSTPGAVSTQLRTFAGLSRRMAAMYAHERPLDARLSRFFWLYPLNSEFFLQALHYLRRSDQDWIFHETMPAALRTRIIRTGIMTVPAEVEALARLVHELQGRGIEVRLVVAPYAPVCEIPNARGFVDRIQRATGVRVWSYIGTITDLDSFADGVHLNERGSRELLAMMVRDGLFGMVRPPARL